MSYLLSIVMMEPVCTNRQKLRKAQGMKNVKETAIERFFPWPTLQSPEFLLRSPAGDRMQARAARRPRRARAPTPNAEAGCEANEKCKMACKNKAEPEPPKVILLYLLIPRFLSTVIRILI